MGIDLWLVINISHILWQGRENQVRIVLNKADTVKPDELLRVQAMLVWNISPLMSSAEPPIM